MRYPRSYLGLAAAVLLLTGCQATGMGTVQSTLVPGDKATFGFVFTTSGLTQEFSGSYHDPQGATNSGIVDISLKGSGALHRCSPGVDPACAKAPANTKGGCLAGNFVPYTSQNPKIPGTGTLQVFVCDGGSPGVQDSMGITIVTGPCASPDAGPCLLPGAYTGYVNEGTPSGNITCTGDCIAAPLP